VGVDGADCGCGGDLSRRVSLSRVRSSRRALAAQDPCVSPADGFRPDPLVPLNVDPLRPTTVRPSAMAKGKIVPKNTDKNGKKKQTKQPVVSRGGLGVAHPVSRSTVSDARAPCRLFLVPVLSLSRPPALSSSSTSPCLPAAHSCRAAEPALVMPPRSARPLPRPRR
jgi:hypothetical protein